MIIENAESSSDQVMVLESNIDDSTGEMLGHAMDKIMGSGALDVSCTPCFMKKNRPGYLLRVIAPAEKVPQIEYAIFANTTTIGIRRYPAARSVMDRAMVELATPYGTIKAKKCIWQDIVKIYPEYESVKAAAEKTQTNFKTVFDAAVAAALQ